MPEKICSKPVLTLEHFSLKAFELMIVCAKGAKQLAKRFGGNALPESFIALSPAASIIALLGATPCKAKRSSPVRILQHTLLPIDLTSLSFVERMHCIISKAKVATLETKTDIP